MVINVVLSASTINYLCWTDKLLFGDKFFSSFSFVQNEYKDKSPPIPFLKPIAHLWNDINTLSHRSNEKNEFSTLKCDAHSIKRNIFGYPENGLEVFRNKSICILASKNEIYIYNGILRTFDFLTPATLNITYLYVLDIQAASYSTSFQIDFFHKN